MRARESCGGWDAGLVQRGSDQMRVPVEPCLIQEPGFQAWLKDDEPCDLELVRNFPEPQFTRQKNHSCIQST